ncbi:hypothetical protein QQA43_32590 (plasmid) [Mycolicibacterium vanbaalenii]|uniref:hypothetical protein n=1 Tax=Mycolicibacterium vanbaalenii TaxID=110539 RepID=UPI0028775D02|nr:hypothetical protein [Mycolicibacterium vanbaalenii]WND60310.1 hypothetical protein QQA43_32590 [Mycolicibacterium vanbaalenii]
MSAAILTGCANPILDTLLDRNAAAPPALPANEVLSLSVVRQEFPMMTRMARTGVDPEAPGTPQATRRSQFSDLTAMVQLTVAVAEYPTDEGAFTAFINLVEGLRSSRGSVGLGRPYVGEDALAIVTRQLVGPMGVTIAARDGPLIIEVRSAGFKYSRDHLERLTRLAERQLSTAVTAAGAPE